MSDIILIAIILSAVVLVVAAFLFGQIYAVRLHTAKRIREAEQEAVKIRQDAQKDAANLIKEKMLEVKEEWYRKKVEFDEQTKTARAQLKTQQDDFLRRERSIEQKGDWITRKEREVGQRETQLKQREDELNRKTAQLDSLIQAQNEKLEQVARMTAEEAKQVLMNNLYERVRNDAAQTIRNIKEQAQLTAREEARHIILQAMDRSALEQVRESTITVVPLPSNEMKGRIIGREGRNIRAFETITGCEVLIDDTPNLIVLSGFDPIRREIARLAMQALIADGRIHPGRIEDVVEKARRDFEETVIAAGEEALFEASVHGSHLEIVKLVGRLKYLSSGGQNLLQHSLETSVIAGLMAAELGFDVQLAKRAGMLHDIGYTQERAEQPHTVIGAELARKYGENLTVQQAILQHHEEPNIANPISVLVQAANRISKERPGAHRQVFESYVQRLRDLETIALSMPGVTQAFAIQAGRELRILVDFNIIDDTKVIQLADEVAHKIETTITYAGQVKITVIREFRAMDMAK